MKHAHLLPWIILFVLVVLAVKQCGEFMDDSAMSAVEPDPTTMMPCPGRKPVKEHGRKYYWYCGVGTEPDGSTHHNVAGVDARPAARRTKVGASCGRTGAARGR
jgi:hypothetical protein